MSNSNAHLPISSDKLIFEVSNLENHLRQFYDYLYLKVVFVPRISGRSLTWSRSTEILYRETTDLMCYVTIKHTRKYKTVETVADR